MKHIAQQSSLSMTGESFALVGEKTPAGICPDCNRAAFLVSGRCEPCAEARAQDLKESDARQRTFFGEEV